MLLDTSVIIEILTRPTPDALLERIAAAAGDEPFFASPIHLGELADAARRRGLPVAEVVRAAQDRVELVPLVAAIAVQASELKAEARRGKAGRAFSLIDGVGLATARSRGLHMLTFDADFEGFPDVTILQR